MIVETPVAAKRRATSGWIAPVLILLVVVGAAAFVRQHTRSEAVAFAKETNDAKPLVITAMAVAAADTTDVTLPGSLEGSPCGHRRSRACWPDAAGDRIAGA
jgi:hypothetical protein